jgi:hypothetical protein
MVGRCLPRAIRDTRYALFAMAAHYTGAPI